MGAEPETELSIVMPCLNEARTLPRCIESAQAFLRDRSVVGEVIVADNGSSDGSASLASARGATVVRVTETGYGAALRGGIAAARGRYVIMGDADGSYDFAAMGPFLEKLREGHELVLGNRFAGGIEAGAMPFLHRYVGNPILSAIGRVLTRSGCSDFYCGLRGFTAGLVDELDVRSVGMEFALEMVIKAETFGRKVTEVPTTLVRDGRGRPSHLRTWRDGWRSLRLFLLWSPKWLFWYPGLVLTIVSATLGTRLWFGPLDLGGVVLDVHTMAYCAVGVAIGFQAVAFALLSKALAVRVGLHPPSRRVKRMLKYASLERGLLLGGVILLLGLIGTVIAFGSWMSGGFGDLDPFHSMRMVIPSVLGLALGSQLILASFSFGFLDLISGAGNRRAGNRGAGHEVAAEERERRVRGGAAR